MNTTTHSTPSATPRPAPGMPQPTPEQIRQARDDAGHTQQQAAELVHVDGRAWRRWELGERQINLAAWELYKIKTLGLILRK